MTDSMSRRAFAEQLALAAEQRGRLDQAQKDLETRLRELTRIRVP